MFNYTGGCGSKFNGTLLKGSIFNYRLGGGGFNYRSCPVSEATINTGNARIAIAYLIRG